MVFYEIQKELKILFEVHKMLISENHLKYMKEKIDFTAKSDFNQWNAFSTNYNYFNAFM